MKLHKVKRRGQATAIGGVFFLLIAILLTNFLYEVISIQQEMNQFDSDRAQERVDISKVFFGNYAKYNMPNTIKQTIDGEGTSVPVVDITNPISSLNFTGSLNPLVNGEFTSDVRGWYFTRTYDPRVFPVTGGSGAYTTEVTGSTSGAGAVYMDFLFNPPSSETARARLEWSRFVNIDLESIGGSVDSSKLTLGRKCTVYDNVLQSTIKTSIIDPDEGRHDGSLVGMALVSPEPILDTEAEWQIKTYQFLEEDGRDVIQAKGSGQYRVVISLEVELKHSATTIPEIKMLIDDVNLEIEFTNHILDLQFSYTLTQSPNLIAELGMVFQSHYGALEGAHDIDVVQGIYIKDQTTTTERWVPLSLSSISTADLKLKYDFSGSDLQNYISARKSNYKEITFRCYTIGSKDFEGVFSVPTLDTLYYSETHDAVIVSIRNWGGVTISIVSVWVNDYSGHNQHPQPTIDTWLDFPISPGETYKLVVPHNWKAGEVKVKIVTSKGTIVQVVTTAY